MILQMLKLAESVLGFSEVPLVEVWVFDGLLEEGWKVRYAR